MESSEKHHANCQCGIIADAIRNLIGFMRKELIFRGILFLILGVLLMFNPSQTLIAITITVGVFILFDGIVMFVSSLRYRGAGLFFHLLNAVFFIVIGVYTCVAPMMMNIIWVAMLGLWQFFSGIHCLGFQGTARKSALFSGILSIISGLFLFFMPIFGLMTLMWIMGLVSLISGVSAIWLGIRLKKALN